MRSESSFLVRHIADCQAVVWFLAPSLDDDASHWAMIVDKNFGLKNAIWRMVIGCGERLVSEICSA